MSLSSQVFEDLEPKLTDFGLTRVANQADFSSVGGTYNYMPPEVFSLAAELKAGPRNIQTKVLPASDVYSFGYLLWEIENEREAYPGLTVASVIELKRKLIKTKVGVSSLPQRECHLNT